MSAFDATVTRDDRVIVRRDGRAIATVAGERGRRLAAQLRDAPGEDERQLALAKATGNYRRGNER